MKSNLFTAETAGSQFVSCDRVGKTSEPPRPSPSDRLLAKETKIYSPSGKRRGSGGGLKELERLIALFKEKLQNSLLQERNCEWQFCG